MTILQSTTNSNDYTDLVKRSENTIINKKSYLDNKQLDVENSFDYNKPNLTPHNLNEQFPEDEPYQPKQSQGYLSILFSIVQVVILILMMYKCDIASLDINPMIGPYPDALDYWGGKNTYKILNNNEIWRLISPILLHAGLIHLICNVSVQLDAGKKFEREWGSGIWLFVYLTSAVGSCICSCCFMSDQISVGSSGAVMGLFGGKLAELTCQCCETPETNQEIAGRQIRKSQLFGILCTVAIVMAMSFLPYVDWSAHAGGTVFGFCSGLLCFSSWNSTSWYGVFCLIIGVLVNIIAYICSIQYMYSNIEPNRDLEDVCEYYKRFFEDYNCNCQLETIY